MFGPPSLVVLAPYSSFNATEAGSRNALPPAGDTAEKHAYESSVEGALAGGKVAVALVHDGIHRDRAAVGFSAPVPNSFCTVSDCGSFSAAAVIDQQTRRAVAFLIGVVTECPGNRTVSCVGLHCICTPPSPARNPPRAKRFFNKSCRGVALNETRIDGVVVAAAEKQSK